MYRRDFLKLTSAGLAGLGAFGLVSSNASRSFAEIATEETSPIYGGWVDSPEARGYFIRHQARPFLDQLNQGIRGTGTGRTVLLWPYLEKAYGHAFTPHAQEIGDCVSHAYGVGIDILAAVQLEKSLVPHMWVAEASTEVIYGGARVQSRVQLDGQSPIPGDGINGVNAAEFIKQFGVLLRQEYGKHDYRRYDGDVARTLGKVGVPVELLVLCKLHPVQTTAIVKSWDEARDAVANGYPVTMCSNVGFSIRRGRDSEGFLPPGRQPWYHAMLIAGIDDNPRRPGGLIINSWGSDWIDGPTRLGQPLGSFWADASTIDRAMRQGDSIAISSYVGYPLQSLDYKVY
jgi:hypothetical protein